MMVRHGVMVVGMTMSGKSVCIDVLSRALTQLQQDQVTDNVMYKVCGFEGFINI